MILTCPECATRYFVDDDRVGPNGRQVRCASCGHRWTATRDEEPLVLEEAPAEVEAPAPAEPEPPPAPHELPAEELPKAFRQREQTRRKERQAAASGMIWAALGGALAVLVAAVILLRQDIAQVWPRAAGAYALAGLPVNLVGLTIEGQHAQPMLKDGHADL
ncbi:MAG: zinc-ribbon domain-containing protein, partial [Caulobacteraceae bacterium]|nr:zinc-ribbon domain-containing protein [Caulobacteraceae bacterium]